MNSCRKCVHFRQESEGWERPDIYWFECRKHPGAANLRSFPFVNTRCPSYKAAKEQSHEQV